MTRKIHLCQGLLCIGLALAISSSSQAGWGSYGGSFGSGGGSGGSGGSSYGSVWGGSSHGSGGGSFGGSYGSHRSHRLFAKHHASSGGSLGGLFGGSHGSSGGSTVVLKAHGSSGGSLGSGSHGSSGGSSGGLFHGGLISKLRSLHQKKMSWLRSSGHGSSGGSSGHHIGHGSTGSSHGSHGGSIFGGRHGSSHGSHGGSHGSHGGYSYSSPVASSIAASTVTPMVAAPNYVDSLVSSSAVFSDSIAKSASAENGTLQVSLPNEAKLFVNGKATTSAGTSRQFVSKGLKSGYRYPYTVKAVMEVEGREVVQSKTVELRAGESLDLAFNFNEAPTKLTVRVPENAIVKLAGAPTNATGVERQFSTTKLEAGQVWTGYEVVVTDNGVTKTQTIDLRSGENRTLTFDFGASDVASK